MQIDLFRPLGSYDYPESPFAWSGVSTEEMRYMLDAAKPGEEIRVRFDCVGGVTNVGVAIANLFREKSRSGNRILGVVLGAAWSAGCVALMGCDEIEVAAGATLMIHEAAGGFYGDAAAFLEQAERLNASSNNIAGIFAARLGLDAAAVRALMKAETWYTADEAVAAGLADKTINAGPPLAPPDLAGLFVNFYKHPPKEIKTMAKTPANPPAANPPANPPAAATPPATVNAAPPVAGDPNPATPPTTPPAIPPAVEPPATVNAAPPAAGVVQVDVAALLNLSTNLVTAAQMLAAAVAAPATPPAAIPPATVNAAPPSFEDRVLQSVAQLQATVNHFTQSGQAVSGGGEPAEPATRRSVFKMAGASRN